MREGTDLETLLSDPEGTQGHRTVFHGSDRLRRLLSVGHNPLNIKTVLEELNASMADILKTTVFLTDLGNFGAVNGIYAEWFGPDYPARSCVQVSALPMGALVEVEAVVSLDQK